MASQTDPLFLLYSVVVAQLLFLTFAVWRAGAHRKKIKWPLLLLAVVLTAMAAEFALTWSGYLARFPDLMGSSSALAFLIGPAIWYYLRPGAADPPWTALAIHLLPFLLAVAWTSSFMLLPAQTKLDIYRESVVTEAYFFSTTYLVMTGLKAVHLAAYLLLSNRPQDLIGRGLRGSGATFVFLLSLHVFLLAARLPFYALTYCVFILLTGVLATWIQWQLAFPEPNKTAASAPKYEKSGLGPAATDDAAKRLTALMETERPYLRADLRLAHLADLLDLPPHQLSQLLNQHFGQKFPDYVNSYRIRYAATLLANPANEDGILQIAFAAGFNSKNSFNRAFRKYWGNSPSEYRKLGSARRMGR